MLKEPFTDHEQQILATLNVKGYRIFVRSFDYPESSKGGILLPDAYRNSEQRALNIGKVLSMGIRAYTPEEVYKEPYCEVGDWILFSPYERDSIPILGTMCYFLNDEKVHATINHLHSIMTTL